VFDVPTWLYLQAITIPAIQKQDISDKHCSKLAYFLHTYLVVAKYCAK